MKTLKDVFINSIKDVYYAETILTKELKILTHIAQHADLRESIMQHHHETLTHISRLEQIFELLWEPLKAKKCLAMDGILAEWKEMLEQADFDVKDIVIVLVSSKIQHYQISAYVWLVTFADHLWYEEVYDVLQENLEEEESALGTLDTLLQVLSGNDDEEL